MIVEQHEPDQFSLLSETHLFISNKRTALSCSSSLVQMEQEFITFCALISSPFRSLLIFSYISRFFFKSLHLVSRSLQLCLSFRISLSAMVLAFTSSLRLNLSSKQSCLAQAIPSLSLSDLMFSSLMALDDFSSSLFSFLQFISERLLSLFYLAISSLRKAIFSSRFLLSRISSVFICMRGKVHLSNWRYGKLERLIPSSLEKNSSLDFRILSVGTGLICLQTSLAAFLCSVWLSRPRSDWMYSSSQVLH